MSQTVSKILEFQSAAEKTFEKNLFNNSLVSLDFNQTQSNLRDKEEFTEYSKQGYQDILED